MLVGIVAWFALSLADAGQRFDVDPAGATWRFAYAWHDDGGQPRQVAFALPSDAVEADEAAPTRLARDEVTAYAARAVTLWARTVDDVDVTAHAEGGKVVMAAEGPPGSTAAVLVEARRVRDGAIAEWLADRDLRRNRAGKVTFDLAELASAYADDVRPLALALRAQAPDARAFATLALSFVQEIPFQAVQDGEDVGFHRPLALLARNAGDCDSKVVLYLSLIRAAFPSVGVAAVTVPGHALAAVAVPGRPGEATLVHDGVRYVFAEPVGPRRAPLGVRGDRAREAGDRLEVHPVPRG